MNIANKIAVINDIYDTELRAIQKSVQWKTLIDTTLTEEQSGAAALKLEITEDISQMKEFKLYIEYPITEENAGVSVYLNAHINGSPSGNNCFFSTHTTNKGAAGSTYTAMSYSTVIDMLDAKEIVSFHTPIAGKNIVGTNARTNAISTRSHWIIPQDESLYLNVNTTATFLAGTRVYMEGR